MSGLHARFAFSDSERWIHCPGSIRLSEGLPPEPDTPESLEGNAADWVAKQYAAGNEVAFGTPTPIPGYTVDYDMIAGAKMWAAAVKYDSVSGVPVTSTIVHPTDAWGEPDNWNWAPIERELDVPDYKYGFGIHDAFEHWQTVLYAGAILESIGELQSADVKVRLTIVQPRAFHKNGPVRTWETTTAKIRQYLYVAAAAAKNADSDAPDTETGPHCLHCPARFHCTTLQRAVTQASTFFGHAERTAMDPAALGTTLSIVRDLGKLVEAYETGLKAQAEGLMRAGQRIPGWKLESTVGRLKWNTGVTPEAAQAAAGSVKVIKPPELITPTQAKTGGVPESVVDKLATRAPGGMKIVRDDGTEARRTFGDAT